MLDAEGKSRREQDQSCFRADPNGVTYASLQDYGMVCPPGVLTEQGRTLAVAIRDAASPAIPRKPMF